MTFFLAFENSIQLVPDGTLLIHVLLILVMVAVLNATLFKPINKILAEREATTGGRITEAQQIVANVKQKLQQYEAQLRDARAEGYSMMEQERLKSLREREAKIIQLRAEINSLLAIEKQELAQESQRVRQDLESESRVLGAEIATQIIGRRVSAG